MNPENYKVTGVIKIEPMKVFFKCPWCGAKTVDNRFQLAQKMSAQCSECGKKVMLCR